MPSTWKKALARRGVVAALFALTVLAACNKGQSSPGPSAGNEVAIDAEEAQSIAEEAYIYAYPMLENYRTMYTQAIDRTDPGYLAPFNQLTHEKELLGPEFKDIVRPNNDTMYSF